MWPSSSWGPTPAAGGRPRLRAPRPATRSCCCGGFRRFLLSRASPAPQERWGGWCLGRDRRAAGGSLCPPAALSQPRHRAHNRCPAISPRACERPQGGPPLLPDQAPSEARVWSDTRASAAPAAPPHPQNRRGGNGTGTVPSVTCSVRVQLRTHRSPCERTSKRNVLEKARPLSAPGSSSAASPSQRASQRAAKHRGRLPLPLTATQDGDMHPSPAGGTATTGRGVPARSHEQPSPHFSLFTF